jgi:CHASE2 domain-containing sensor protein
MVIRHGFWYRRFEWISDFQIRIMGLKTKLTANMRNGVIGAALSVFCGLLFWNPLGLGRGFVRLSYDLPFRFSPKVNVDKLILITMDEVSYRNLGEDYDKKLDRKYHAELLDKLTEAQLVVFDTFFSDPGSKASNEELARALKTHGRVVLAADREKRTILPLGIFQKAVGSNWGIARMLPASDREARVLFTGTADEPSLAWAAASLAHARITQSPERRMDERWIRHYGPHGTFTNISYFSALKEKDPAFFQNKIIFVGGRPDIVLVGEKTDEFRTPYTRWGEGNWSSGLEVVATMFLNLYRGDWLTQLSEGSELLLLILSGLLLGFGLTFFRPIPAAGLALLGAVSVGVVAVIVIWQTQIWFSWMIIAGAQIPCALGWSVLAYTKTLFREKQALETKLAATPQPMLLPQPSSIQSEQPTAVVPSLEARQSPPIPNYELIRCVGQGSFGKVWLARNTIGMYHAVKIVHRAEFRDAAPYEREFKGIQKYMPVSLNHPGFLRILHVGRNDEAGYFYYMMEVGDDEITGQKIEPATYSPKNLAKELDKRRKLPVVECVQLSITLAAVLEDLHQQHLIHRDIKPSNIIFVNGVPKFADIGLVTDIVTKIGDASYAGTAGFIAPEGPGAPPADIYSLGKVIYEASMGRGREYFPELPTTLVERGDYRELLLLNEIILKACEKDLNIRYQAAAELHADLLALQSKISPPQEN